MPDQTVRLFGIRHHGPGCARSLLRALEALQPDCLLVEGPPDGESVLPFLTEETMRPPVALLVYAPDEPRRAAFYPFAEFSPEWQALGYGLRRAIPVRFMDLPVTHQFALDKAWEEEDAAAEEEAEKALALSAPPDAGTPGAPETAEASSDAPDAPESTEDAEDDTPDDVPEIYGDPLDWLGRAAGYADGEAWWNHMVEERLDGLELFEAIREAMTTLRAETPRRERSERETRREAMREAHMRKCLRQAKKEGFERIAVVCGAWHVPVLEAPAPVKQDADLLKGLPKMKVAATWTPWTYANLSSRSGYGAGVSSPAWYEHLWRSGDGDRAIGWLTRAARLFREQDMDCSSAHVIEAARLAESLAAMRERTRPGLEELYEALRAIVCMGEDTPLRFIEQRLIVGDRLGAVPEATPTVPLQRDLERQQKSLRLKPEASQKVLDLDLRQPNDLARSHLLHRLRLLGIAWGSPSSGGHGAKGTFHELWETQWTPELAIAVIAAGRWGNTVAEAAASKAADTANTAELLELAELVNDILLADLPDAVGHATRMLEEKAATTDDVAQLLDGLPALASIARYGNVRQTDAGMVLRVLEGLVPRAAIGLPGACTSLDAENAAAMRKRIIAAHNAIRPLDNEPLWEEWLAALRRTALRDGSVHELLRGLAVRLLFEEQRLDADEVARQMSLALSTASAPAAAAAWIEGFLNQSALVLLHDDALWDMLARWMDGLTDDHFIQILPMLRRTFSGFSAPERRRLGERAKRPGGGAAKERLEAYWDPARAALPIPLLRRLLGLAEQS